MLLALLTACLRPSPIGTDDWPASGCAAPATLSDTLRVGEQDALLALADGPTLAAGLLIPKEEGCYPAVLLVPPGFEPGLAELQEEAHQALAARGVVVMAFDPRGRGESEGEDDHGGPVHQDDLAAIATWLASRPEVDPARVVIRSRSFGVAMLAGALERHPSIAPVAVMDIEGPALLPDDLEHVPEFTRDNVSGMATDGQWWEDRSASLHIGSYTGHYERVQGRLDHATGPWRGHAVEMLQAAQAGAPRRVDLNGQPAEIWDEDVVSELVLPGEIEHGDDAVIALLEALLVESP